MTAAAVRPQIWKSLGFRMAFALAVALLPLGVVSAMQSRSLLIEAQARSQAALLGETLLAAAPEAGLFRAARSSASTLAAAMAALSSDPVGTLGMSILTGQMDVYIFRNSKKVIVWTDSSIKSTSYPSIALINRFLKELKKQN